jgi:hypothetical protein
MAGSLGLGVEGRRHVYFLPVTATYAIGKSAATRRMLRRIWRLPC